jgi:hypothetical protein
MSKSAAKKARLAFNRAARAAVGAESHVAVCVVLGDASAPVLSGEQAYYDREESAHYASTIVVTVGADWKAQ